MLHPEQRGEQPHGECSHRAKMSQMKGLRNRCQSDAKTDGNGSPDITLLPKIFECFCLIGTSYLRCRYADVSFWRFAARPRHRDSHLEPGSSGGHGERYLLAGAGFPAAPLQRRLEAPERPIKPLLGRGGDWVREAQYLVGLLRRHVHRVADEFSIGTDAVDGDAGLGGPGHGGRQGKGGGRVLGPSSQHQASGAHLERTDFKDSKPSHMHQD